MGEMELIGILGETLTAQYEVFKSFIDGVNLKIEQSIENTRLKQIDQAINLAYANNATDAYIATLQEQRNQLVQRQTTTYLIVFIVVVLIIVTLIKKK